MYNSDTNSKENQYIILAVNATLIQTAENMSKNNNNNNLV